MSSTTDGKVEALRKAILDRKRNSMSACLKAVRSPVARHRFYRLAAKPKNGCSVGIERR
jgi:hypothetical protein